MKELDHPVGHVVERARDLAELVAPRELHARRELALTNRARRRAELRERPRQAPREQPRRDADHQEHRADDERSGRWGQGPANELEELPGRPIGKLERGHDAEVSEVHAPATDGARRRRKPGRRPVGGGAGRRAGRARARGPRRRGSAKAPAEARAGRPPDVSVRDLSRRARPRVGRRRREHPVVRADDDERREQVRARGQQLFVERGLIAEATLDLPRDEAQLIVVRAPRRLAERVERGETHRDDRELREADQVDAERDPRSPAEPRAHGAPGARM